MKMMSRADICAELGIERGPDKMWIGLDHLTHG